jgi:hypothetical protein
MSVVLFLSALSDGSPVIVPPVSHSVPEKEISVMGIIEAIDSAARAEVAYVAPPLLWEVTQWAAERLYRACQFLVYREIGADEVRADSAVKCPAPPSPATCYSADLVLRYLPDVFALARGIAREDPLVDGLLELARAWALSSVGVPDVGEVDVTPFVRHAGLRRLYVDRIITRDDRSRVGDAEIAQAVREAVGAFPSLCPGIWAALTPERVAS